MVTLSLLKYLENNGFGTIDQDLFWEKMSIDDDGVYISDLGGNNTRDGRPSISYQLYSRGENDVEAYQKLQSIAEFLNDSFAVCQLPAAPPTTDYGYDNVTILPVSSITNIGEDINGRIIYSITGQLYYGGKIKPPDPPLAGDYIETEDNNALITENDKTIFTEEDNG